MFCHECGTKNSASAKFCYNCGTKLVGLKVERAGQSLNENVQTKPASPVLESDVNLRFGKVGWPTKAKATLYKDKIVIINGKNGEEVLHSLLENLEEVKLTGSNRVLTLIVGGKFYGLDFTSIKRAATFGAFGAVGALAGMASDPSKNTALYWKTTIEQLQKR